MKNLLKDDNLKIGFVKYYRETETIFIGKCVYVRGYPVAWILANDGLFLGDYLQKVYLKYELQHKKEPRLAVLLFSDSN
ncbi:hypothetical protein NG20_03795 [Bacillus subtilis]|nr:hypothetical protein NG20_03795 [Bacillus subtilis]